MVTCLNQRYIGSGNGQNIRCNGRGYCSTIVSLKANKDLLYNTANISLNFSKAVPEVPAIKDGYNPATWMLEISTQAAEQRI